MRSKRRQLPHLAAAAAAVRRRRKQQQLCCVTASSLEVELFHQFVSALKTAGSVG
jgi:hypothetical protein